MKVCVGLQDLIPRWLTLVAVGWKPQFLATWTLHGTAWVPSQYGSWLLPEQVIQEEGQGGSFNAFYDLVLEVTHCHFCPILFVTRKSLSQAQGERI